MQVRRWTLVFRIQALATLVPQTQESWMPEFQMRELKSTLAPWMPEAWMTRALLKMVECSTQGRERHNFFVKNQGEVGPDFYVQPKAVR
jgi:hypothetical protein